MYKPRGASLLTYVSSWDLDTPGSPTSSTLSSPLMRPPVKVWTAQLHLARRKEPFLLVHSSL